MNAINDVAISIVAKAREAEAAFTASLSAGHVVPDTADDALYDAFSVVPSTVQGIREKISLALEIEGAGWDRDAVTLLRSLLLSPVLTVPA